MLRHVAMYRWADHVDAEHVARVRAALDELAGLAGVRRHDHGADVGVSVGSYDYHVVVEFETLADWRAYRDHPLHVLLVAELIDGHVVEQATGQYQTGPEALDAHTDSGRGPVEQQLESDAELLARARRAAAAEMEALLAEPDEPV